MLIETTSRTRLDTVSTEIIFEICDYLCDLSDPDDGPCSLKALRLVSRHFNSLPLSYLFSTLFIYMHTDRWSALNNIANTPHLARHVNRIEISNAELTRDFYDYNRWQRCRAHEVFQCLQWPEPPKQLRQGVGSTMARTYNELRASPSQEAAYSRYQTWYNGESALVDLLREGKTPPLDLHKLPNLRAVTTHDARLQFNVRFSHSSDPRRYTYSRRVLETGTNYFDGLDNTHLSLFMLAINLSDFTLSKLQISHFSELLSDRCHRPFTIPSLHHLVVGPPTVGKPIGTGDVGMPLRLATWVTTLPQLSVFEVYRTRECVDNTDLFAMLHDAHWPKLRIVRLQLVRSSAASLRHFLLEMYSFKILPFEELVIEDPVIIPEDWALLKRELELLDPKPPVLELSGPFKPWFGKRRRGKKRRVWWERYARSPLNEWPF